MGFCTVAVPPSPKVHNQATSWLLGAVERSVNPVESSAQAAAYENRATGFGLTAICLVVSLVQLLVVVTLRVTM